MSVPQATAGERSHISKSTMASSRKRKHQRVYIELKGPLGKKFYINSNQFLEFFYICEIKFPLQ